MSLTRRNVLIGIALVAVVSGVALGSGAFTQVEATRTVDLGVSDDSNALLGLGPGDGATGIVSNETENGQEILTLEESDLNENATTRFDDAIRVDNNGDEEVQLSITGATGALDIQHDGTSVAGSPETIGSGDYKQFDVVVNTTDSDTLPDSVTFNATATNP